MLFAVLTLLTALLLASISGAFSIIGLVTMFGAKMWVYGTVIEVGKIVAISYIYRYWYVTNKTFLAMLSFIAILLMLITSMGVYALLSKGHVDVIGNLDEHKGSIEQLDIKIDALTANVQSRQAVITNLDNALERYIQLGAITKGLNARDSQREQRDYIESEIKDLNSRISILVSDKYAIEKELRLVENEVAPLRYIALILGNDEQSSIDTAVKVAIILLVICLDPLAVLLLIGANVALTNINNPNVQNEFNIDKAKTDSSPSVDNDTVNTQEGYEKVMDYIQKLKEDEEIITTTKQPEDNNTSSDTSKTEKKAYVKSSWM